ncbi:MAG: hypothetical protein JSS89_02695 [Bacteroidetes bacterium]|nr:hypothetical protein [Bacteroidota bacterium]
MGKLLLWTLIQAIFGVGGTALLTHTLHGKGVSVASLTESALSWQGMVGIVLMFGSFLTMGYVLSFAKLSSYIPISTALTFLLTLIVTTTIQKEELTIQIIGGMVLIAAGIMLASWSRSAL